MVGCQDATELPGGEARAIASAEGPCQPVIWLKMGHVWGASLGDDSYDGFNYLKVA